MSSKSIQEAAARALKDHKFAQKVLSGHEDFPEIRDAILGDLFASTHAPAQATDDPKATKTRLETRFIDAGPRFGAMGPCYVKYYPKMPAMDAWTNWQEMERPNLQRIAGAQRQEST